MKEQRKMALQMVIVDYRSIDVYLKACVSSDVARRLEKLLVSAPHNSPMPTPICRKSRSLN